MADAGRLYVGSGRPVPKLCDEVCRYQPRYPAIEYEPALGIVIGIAGIQRTAWIEGKHLRGSDWRIFPDGLRRPGYFRKLSAGGRIRKLEAGSPAGNRAIRNRSG